VRLRPATSNCMCSCGEGWRVNHKRVYRLSPRRGWRPTAPAAAASQCGGPGPPAGAHAANEQWAMDFMHDTLADGAQYGS